MTRNVITKKPSAILNYLFDWAPLTNGNGCSNWLASGETLASYTITAETGITVDSDELTNTNTSVSVVLSGGTAGETYDITCNIVTTPNGFEDGRTMTIRVRER